MQLMICHATDNIVAETTYRIGYRPSRNLNPTGYTITLYYDMIG